MRIRAMKAHDLDGLIDIDGTIEANGYLHVVAEGTGLATAWRIDERPLREKRIDANAIDEDRRFSIRQIVAGGEEGLALLAEHEDRPVGLLACGISPDRGVLRVIDLRVDFDVRRQGVGSAMIYKAMATARDLKLRALAAESLTNNPAACQLFARTGFALCGLDTHRRSNHDLVKEAVTLFWYAAFD